MTFQISVLLKKGPWLPLSMRATDEMPSPPPPFPSQITFLGWLVLTSDLQKASSQNRTCTIGYNDFDFF
jgi:hypothetical protein